jgi:hypothetical protein
MSGTGARDSHLRWLADELAALVGVGVIEQAAADRLRAHYGLDRFGPRRNWAVLALAVLGAAMIGAGVLLILAHNWDELSRPARAAIALGALLGAQGCGGWALARHPRSAAWREGSAVAITAGLGTAIALVSQTYHVEGSLAAFMQAWLWLTVPVVYVFESRVVCAYVLAAAPVVAFERHDAPLAFLALFLAAAAYVIHLLRTEREAGLTRLCALAGAVSLPLGTGAFVSDAYLEPWPVFYAGYVGALASLGLRFERAPAPSFASPLSSGALAGAVALALALSFEDAWTPPVGEATAHATAVGMGLLTVGALLGVSAVAHVARAWRAGEPAMALVCALPVVAGLGQVLVLARAPDAAGLVLHNGYVLSLGVAALAGGIRAASLRRTNGGLVILAIVFLVRFFDVELSFVTRGLGFIAVGIAFVATNVWLARRKREAAT